MEMTLPKHGRYGDAVFQPRKGHRSGLWDAVEGRVLIYIHKEQMLADVERRYPARHYVMMDNKLRILTVMKEIWEDRLTTVFPRQGHYALDSGNVATYPPADITIKHIGDLITYDPAAFIDASVRYRRSAVKKASVNDTAFRDKLEGGDNR
jgi:hypothetical protein